MKREKGTWGGSREGAGRKKTSSFVSHLKRPRIEGRKFPLLITHRLRSDLPSLRDPLLFEVFQKASSRARRFGLRLLEYRVDPKRITMLCEFKNREELEKSFKSLNTALAVAIKKLQFKVTGATHTGPVFLGRFMMEEINDPRRFAQILKEMFFENPDDHKPHPLIGPYTSAPLFQKWNDLMGGVKKAPTSILLPSGESVASRMSHQDDKEMIRKITASPQFSFSKTALRSFASVKES